MNMKASSAKRNKHSSAREFMFVERSNTNKPNLSSKERKVIRTEAQLHLDTVPDAYSLDEEVSDGEVASVKDVEWSLKLEDFFPYDFGHLGFPR